MVTVQEILAVLEKIAKANMMLLDRIERVEQQFEERLEKLEAMRQCSSCLRILADDNAMSAHRCYPEFGS